MLLGLTLGTTKASQTAKEAGPVVHRRQGQPPPDGRRREAAAGRLPGHVHQPAEQRPEEDLRGRGMRAANVLIEQGVKGWEKYRGAVDQTGQAAKMADARMSGTKGALEQLSGSIETAQIKLGEGSRAAVQDVANGAGRQPRPGDGRRDRLGGDVGPCRAVRRRSCSSAGPLVTSPGSSWTCPPGEVHRWSKPRLAGVHLPRLPPGSGSSRRRRTVHLRPGLRARAHRTRDPGQAASMAMSKMGGEAGRPPAWAGCWRSRMVRSRRTRPKGDALLTTRVAR